MDSFKISEGKGSLKMFKCIQILSTKYIEKSLKTLFT